MAYAALIAASIRPPSRWDSSTDPPTPIFDPPLTAAEQTTLTDIRTMLRFGVTLTLAEWQSIKAAAIEARTFRQRSGQTWNGLTTAQREADELQWLRDLTDILAVIIRS